MAKELYSTLSRTIHNFQPSKDFDQYTPMPGQSDSMQIDFMTAMKPLRKNLNDDENPIWDKERARYPGQVVDVGQTAEPEKPTGTVNEVKKPVSATDGILFALGRTWEISIRGRQLNVHRQGRVLYPVKLLRVKKDPLDSGPSHGLHVENFLVNQSEPRADTDPVTLPSIFDCVPWPRLLRERAAARSLHRPVAAVRSSWCEVMPWKKITMAELLYTVR